MAKMAYELSLVVYNRKLCGKPPLFDFEGSNVRMRLRYFEERYVFAYYKNPAEFRSNKFNILKREAISRELCTYEFNSWIELHKIVCSSATGLCI